MIASLAEQESMMRAFVASLLLACAVATGTVTEVQAGQPVPTSQVPGVYRFMIGDVSVSALSDGTVPINLHELLRGITPAKTDEILASHYLASPLEASINAFLIENGSRRVLVDTGAGELLGAGNGGRLPEALRAAGVEPEQINDILITHVHTDHSGGLVVHGKVMFPNAVIHVGKSDLDYFLEKANAVRTGYAPRYFDEAAAMLKPYMSAGKVQPFTGRTEVVPGIVAELHPGHTPGSAFYTLTSGGQHVVFIGDIVHAGAVQFSLRLRLAGVPCVGLLRSAPRRPSD